METNEMYEKIKSINNLCTKRLKLRWFEAKDIGDIYEYASDEEVVEYLTWPAHQSIEHTTKMFSDFFESKPEMFAIELCEEGKCVGCIDLRIDHNNDKASFGYVLNKKYWNKGIMTEALNEILRVSFEDLLLNRVEATHYVGNEKSGKVMTKCKMAYEGLGKKELKIKGKYVDVVHYGILKEDWKKVLS